jgi:hypothetical protein
MDSEVVVAKPSRRTEKVLAAIIIFIFVLGLGGYASAYILSPSIMRHPSHAHFHFRMILLNNGQAVNFGNAAFQTDFNHDICSAALTKEPIHFHDNADQYGHIHWDGITGGLLLKNFGWNFIGGFPDALGYRFDQGIIPKQVPIHGHALPQRATNTRYFIYTGTASSHAERKWSDFIDQPLATFVHGTPVIDPAEDSQLMALDMTKASMNDVDGNIVIFAQGSQPSDAAVTTEFSKLKPLPDSPCEG